MPAPIPSYRLYREKTGESADFWIHCETIPERTHLHNWEIAKHRHDGFFQIFCLTSGHGEITELDGVRQLAAPCAIFIPAGAAHGFRFSREIDGLVITALGERLRPIAAADRRLGDFTGAIRIVALSPGGEDAEFARTCIERLHREVHGRALGRMALLEPMMASAVIGLCRVAHAASESVEGSADHDRRRIEALTTLIAAHFRENRPVQFYAAAIGVSATHLNRIARAATGNSVKGLIALHVMETARRDLVFTPTPVQAIAYSLGFSDPAYFNRFFRRQTGLTPGAFREAERRKLAA